MLRRGMLPVALGAAGAMLFAGTAQAATIAAPASVDRSCTAKALTTGAGYVQQTVAAPAVGSVTARLDGATGDWDLAVFDKLTGRVVAGSAYRGSHEVAAGFTPQATTLTVQACRVSGGAGTATLTVATKALDVSGAAAQPSSLVRVATPTRARVNQLAGLGLDLTEHGGAGFREVVLHGAADAAKLTAAGLQYTVEVPDLAAQSRLDRRADAQFAAANVTTALPSGRTTYRRLFDYSDEMKRLAREHPDLVRGITLNHRTWEDRPVEGIEITTNPNARDGKPVFVQLGAHHAREWPSAEHAMEWAYELILGYRRGDARTKRLVETTRTIIVPVVNVDGFNASREAGELMGAGGGRGDVIGSADDETVNIVLHPNEYRRKNCRLITDEAAGNCAQPAFGLASAGVDPNRNYGGFWGGPGASGDPTNETYYGPGPFSEPETQNVRELVSSRQVTTLITNHTFSNLVLRPPGIQVQGPTPDEPAYKALGDSMAAQNGYASQFGYELYDTTGTTEDWSYFATGGLGFTFEIGPDHFHPPFAETVAEYEGTTAAANGGGGNRAAYFLAQENTANTAAHSVLTGRAPAGAVLRLKKTFQTPTSQDTTFTDTLDSTLLVPSGGAFEWHVNPSTRPLVAQERGRAPAGDPSPPQTFSSTGGTVPCANFDDPPEGCYEDHVITVPSGAGIDNARATIRVEWATPASDYDMKVLRDGVEVGSSGQGTTNFEEVTLGDPAPGDYVVRVINFAGAEPFTGTVSFEGPEAFQPAQTETWTLMCEQPEGTIRSARQVAIARGERRSLDLRSACARRQ
jgi:zinc carboxypeptidase